MTLPRPVPDAPYSDAAGRGAVPRAMPPWLAVAVFMLLYAVAVAFADATVRATGEVSLFWPAAGIALGGAMVFGARIAFAMVPVLVFHHLVVAPVPPVFVPFSLVSNVGGVLLALWVLRHIGVLSAREVLMVHAWKVLFAGIVMCVFSASVGVPGTHVAGMIGADALAPAWVHWMFGNLLGVTAIAPAVLFAPVGRRRTGRLPEHEYAREPERLAWLVCLTSSYLVMAWGATNGGPYVLGLTAWPLVVLAWGAMRFRPWWTAFAVAATCLLIAVFAGFGLAGFSVPRGAMDAAQLLGFLNLLSVLPMTIALAVHERRVSARRMLRTATTDPISALPNRTAFEQSSRERLGTPGGPPRALAYIDLDHFKLVNDTASHVAGDAVIRGIAGVLAAGARPNDLVGHLGGDSFAVLMHNVMPAAAEERARQVLRDIGTYRCAWEGQALGTTASIGLVPFKGDDADFSRLLSQADAACFTAKELGGDQVCLAAVDGGEKLDRTHAMRWAMRAREAVERRTLVLHAQAIAPLRPQPRAGRHFELLLRLRDPVTGELLLPSQFFPAAERFRLGLRIDREVVEQGLAWLERHADPGEVEMCSINLSAEALVDEAFIGFLGDRVRRSAFPAEKLCLEITETSALRDIARAQRFIGHMRALGCHFALDDFGAGFCSFGYLRTLDVDYFKIDGSFVRELGTSPLSLPIVRAITDIAHTLHKSSIAEHTETPEQIATLAGLGVDMAQGFAVHVPEPIERYFARPVVQLMPAA